MAPVLCARDATDGAEEVALSARSAVPKEEADEQIKRERDERNCFYCLEGWVFLGSIGHDGEEVYESVRCKRCDGTGVPTRS
jgi:hypothetical protein